MHEEAVKKHHNLDSSIGMDREHYKHDNKRSVKKELREEDFYDDDEEDEPLDNDYEDESDEEDEEEDKVLAAAVDDVMPPSPFQKTVVREDDSLVKVHVTEVSPQRLGDDPEANKATEDKVMASFFASSGG